MFLLEMIGRQFDYLSKYCIYVKDLERKFYQRQFVIIVITYQCDDMPSKSFPNVLALRSALVEHLTLLEKHFLELSCFALLFHIETQTIATNPKTPANAFNFQ